LPEEVKKLKLLVRWLEDLKLDLSRTRNRIESGDKPRPIAASSQRYVKFLESEIRRISGEIDDHFDKHPDLKKDKELLESIPGIGSVCSSIILTDFRAFEGFDSARQAAAFAGVTPYRRQSGTSLNTNGCISRIGSSRIRKAFYLCAVVASRFNPNLKAAYQDLLARGKPKKLALIAIARRLIHIAFGVLRSGKPFDPGYINSAFAPSL
jgi:transposase